MLMVIPKPREIVKNWYFWIIVVTALAIIIRSIPAWINAAWGCDFGIYYGLTKSLVENQDLFNPYSGWGSSYQYFPVLYAITGGMHWLTGVDVLTIMTKIAPIFGGLSVLIFYFVIYELLGDKKKAFLSMLLFAVMPFHVYQTSHASPLTVGHFFMMLSLYFFIKYRQDTRYIIPLSISTILLVMSHHLTTYFYLISLLMIVFVENASIREWASSLKKDVVYIILASGIIFSYWMIVATPVYESFMKSGLKLGSIHISSQYMILLFYLGVFLMFGIIWLKRKLNLFREKKKPSVKSAVLKFSLTMIICLSAMAFFSFVKLPWTNFSFTFLSIVYSIPLLLVFGFAIAGFRYVGLEKNGHFIRGWLLAIVFSFVFSIVTNSAALFPHRHLEYMMAPLSIIAIFGISAIFLNLRYEKISSFTNKIRSTKKPAIYFFKKSSLLQKRNIIYLAVILFLVTANAISVYPSHVALNASYEVITDEDLACIDWMERNLDKNRTVIASDHRLARVTEAVGFNTTVDEASIIWVAEDFVDCLFELEGIGKNYSRITHVLIDDILTERVVHVGFGEIFYMTNESYEKFSNQPFELVYRNATINPDTEEESWTEVYKVNWAYIEEYFR